MTKYTFLYDDKLADHKARENMMLQQSPGRFSRRFFWDTFKGKKDAFQYQPGNEKAHNR